MRNIGSSVGISVVQFLVTENTQVLHADLAAHVTPFNPATPVDIASLSGLASLNAMITSQAAMIAYIDDFHLMMIMALGAMPLLLLLRRTRPQPGAAAIALD